MLFDLEGFEYPAAMADDLSREDEKQRRKKMLMSFPEALLGLSLTRRGPNVSFI